MKLFGHTIKTSVWLPAMLFIYATLFYGYFFLFEEMEWSIRNIIVIAVTYLIVVLVWWLNYRREHNSDETSNRKIIK